MKTDNRFYILLLFSFLMLSNKNFAQLTLTNIAELEKIKHGTTFFAMKDPNSPKAKAFVDAIKKNWTFNKVACIKYTEVEKNIVTGNAFLTIGGSLKTSSRTSDDGNTHLYLQLWTTNGNFIYDPTKRRHFQPEDQMLIAAIDMFVDYTTLISPSSLYRMDYDGNGHIKNWGPGILGNYIQGLNNLLLKGQERKEDLEITNHPALKKLAIDTLYVPDYVLVKYNKNDNDESKRYEPKQLFVDYPFPYKVISIDALNQKIAKSTSPFNYLLYTKSGTEKWVNIMDASSGEIIYAVFSSFYSFKPSDLKDIAKQIQKNK